MKLLYIADLYPAYVRDFYGRRPALELEGYAHQRRCLEEHGFAWNGAWAPALAPLGYEVAEIYPNAWPLQRTWAWEHERGLLPNDDMRGIAVAQARAFAPDVVFFDQYDEALLEALRAAVPGIRLVVGWVGGTLPPSDIWRKVDVVLSCAPESVAGLRALGIRAEHMHHGFNDALLPRLRSAGAPSGVGFFGQIIMSGSFHQERARFFETLLDAGVPLRLHSPSADFGPREELIMLARLGAWSAEKVLRGARVPDAVIRRIPLVRRASSWHYRPAAPVSRKLKPHLRPAAYGLDMLQAIADTCVTLNVHADSSIRYASNMRIFETTGAGSCLLTDWRENLPELFEPEKEVVTFRSIPECIERIRWLLDHPAEAQAIAKAGQARTLRDHTYARRAERLHAVIRDNLK
jgi:spore maturation protein CgeB